MVAVDNFGNKINKGDYIVRSMPGGFVFHKILNITDKSIVVNRFKKNYGTKGQFYWDNASTLEQLKDCSETEGKLYLNKQWTVYVKLISEEQWITKK